MRRSNLVTTRCVSVASLFGCLLLSFSPQGTNAGEPGRSVPIGGGRHAPAEQAPLADGPSPQRQNANLSTNEWPTAFRLWQLPMGCCCYVIAPTNSQSAIVIDPGASPKDLIRFLEGTNLVVKYVLLTHDHWDHANAVPEIMKRYKDATLICHENSPELAGLKPKIGARRVAAVKGHGLDNSSGTITMEGLTLKACRVSEHAIGHVVFYLGAGREHHLFSGDVGRIKASCGNDKVRKYLPDLPATIVVWFGHDGPVTAWVADLLDEKPAATARTPVEENALKVSLPARASTTTNAAAVQFVSRLENEVFVELNLVRADPPKYAESIRQYRKEFINAFVHRGKGKTAIRTTEGVKAVDEAIAYLGKAKALPPLKASEGLSLSAKDHVEDTGKKGLMGHDGSDRSTMEQRIGRYGKWEEAAGENISYGFDTARDIVFQLIIDDGVPSRGHRSNIFATEFHTVGVAFGVHKTWHYMCVMDFAGGFRDDPMAVGNRKKEKKP